MAITLAELGLAPGRFTIDAVDISARHLAAAGRGVYRPLSLRGIDPDLCRRHFHATRAGGAPTYTLDPSIRGQVRFHRGNLLDPGLLEGQAPYDVIFCRNVLIYFDAASRRRALDTLDRLLAPAGLLFVGHAERQAVDDPRFEPYGASDGFALRRAGTGPTPPSPRPSPRRGEGENRPPLAPGQGDGVRARDRAIVAPQGPHGDRPLPPPVLPESSAVLLAEAVALADRGLLDEAAGHCERAIARFGPGAPALFLLGMVRQAGGRLDEAEACFRKVIYLDPAHDEALLALALLAGRRGDSAAAAGYQRRAARARARKGTP